VFPASSLRKEADINQGLVLGTVDIILRSALRIILKPDLVIRNSWGSTMD
jgi:hypothetical protein